MLNFGDVSDSGGILTFDLQKLKGDNQRPRVFDHKATNCFTQPLATTAYIQYMYTTLQV